MTALFLALTSNVFFATASIYFTKYSKKYSPEWMNFTKAGIATLGFGLTCWLGGQWVAPNSTSIQLLILSGTLGLFIGDIFLLRAFTHLGSGRTLMVFGFQPLLMGLAAKLFLGQDFAAIRLFAVIFLILCLFSFSLETFKEKGHWDVTGIIYALLGVLLDATGVFLTRLAFELSPNTTAFSANFIRAGAAFMGFLLMGLLWKKLKLFATFKLVTKPDLRGVIVASIFGTFLSLSFYLMAIKIGHLASITAIACTSPLFATLIETARGHRPLTRYLVAGIVFFLCGFTLLTLT